MAILWLENSQIHSIIPHWEGTLLAQVRWSHQQYSNTGVTPRKQFKHNWTQEIASLWSPNKSLNQ